MFGLPDHTTSDMLACLLFGSAAVLIMALGTLFFDWAYRKVDLQTEVKKGNISAGILLASVVLGLALVMSQTIKSITGG